MAYHDHTNIEGHTAETWSRAIAAVLAIVLGAILLFALLDDTGAGSLGSVPGTQVSNPQVPAQMEDWRGNSAHMPAR